MKRQQFQVTHVASALAVAMLCAAVAQAEPISHKRTLSRVDYVVAGVSGTGGGSGTITVAGVSGTVSHAFLIWHGINNSGVGAVYDNATVTINGNSVTGLPLGDATTNCWGDGSSRAFEANVTAFVPGNGPYVIAGLSNGPGHNSNGAALVVVFNDGNPANNRDLVFFEGNDSNFPDGFPGETDGWHASLSPINYGGGPVSAIAALGDGQDFQDNSLTFATVNGSVTIPDDVLLWDGISVPTAGTSRAPNGQLFDIHTLDITAAFGGVSGPVTLNVDGQSGFSDCLGLVLLLLDLEPGTAPPVPGTEGGMTGGGNVLDATYGRVTYGFSLHCDATQTPNNIQVNWGRGQKFHLTNLATSTCSDDPAVTPDPPVAGHDTILAEGTGRYNNTDGATIQFIAQDAGEPGRDDKIRIRIMNGAVLVLDVVLQTVRGGNLQAQ